MQAQDSRNYLHASATSGSRSPNNPETRKGLLTCEFCVILDQVPLLI